MIVFNAGASAHIGNTSMNLKKNSWRSAIYMEYFINKRARACIRNNKNLISTEILEKSIKLIDLDYSKMFMRYLLKLSID